MSRDWTAFLVDEVEELLGAGRVGLYEFFEILRSQASPPEEAEWEQIANGAFDQLMRRSDVRLYRLEWAGPFREPADGAVPTQADWQTPTEKPYLALDTV